MRIPRYSQFLDVRAAEWKTRACGIVAAKMLIDALAPKKKISFDKLIELGITKGAYIKNVGWSHKGLASLARAFGLYGKNYDWFNFSPADAFQKINNITHSPFLASVCKYFNTKNSGHIIVITKISENSVTYLEPASHTRGGIERTVSIATFLKGWKRRIIVIKKLQK